MGEALLRNLNRALGPTKNALSAARSLTNFGKKQDIRRKSFTRARGHTKLCSKPRCTIAGRRVFQTQNWPQTVDMKRTKNDLVVPSCLPSLLLWLSPSFPTENLSLPPLPQTVRPSEPSFPLNVALPDPIPSRSLLPPLGSSDPLPPIVTSRPCHQLQWCDDYLMTGQLFNLSLPGVTALEGSLTIAITSPDFSRRAITD